MKRKEEPEEEGGGYSWQDTYGDMVTLLLCFFVLLYSFSSFDAQKWKKIVAAFTGSAGNAEVSVYDESAGNDTSVGDTSTALEYNEDTDENTGNANQEVTDNEFENLYNNVLAYVNANDMQDEISVIKSENTILIRFNEMALFDSGRADILPASQEILYDITELISENVSAVEMVHIEGHTDNVPINNDQFTDNWDLSTKRATNTLRLILGTGLIDASKLSATGYGEYQPIATNDTEAGRAQNRRVDIVLQKLNSD